MLRTMRRSRHMALTGMRNLWGNRWSSIAAALSLAAALTMTGIAVLLGQQIDTVKGSWYDKAQIAVYLCTDDSVANGCTGAPSPQEREALRTTLETFDGVEGVYFESREQAYASFLERFGGSDIARTVSPEALPESFRVDMPRGPQRDALLAGIASQPGVEAVQDQHRLLGAFFDLAEKVRVAAFLFAATQVFIAGILLVHLVRSSLVRRRRELEIMNLIGVSPRVMRGPYLLEILSVTALAAATAAGLLRLLVRYAGPAVARAAGDGVAPVEMATANITSLWLWLTASGATWGIGRVTLRRWRMR